jgi:hypothetical protein
VKNGNDTGTLYVDGSYAVSSTISSFDFEGPVFFGIHYMDGDGLLYNFMTGTFDEFTLYDTAFTDEEITELYDSYLPETTTTTEATTTTAATTTTSSSEISSSSSSSSVESSTSSSSLQSSSSSSFASSTSSSAASTTSSSAYSSSSEESSSSVVYASTSSSELSSSSSQAASTTSSSYASSSSSYASSSSSGATTTTTLLFTNIIDFISGTASVFTALLKVVIYSGIIVLGILIIFALPAVFLLIKSKFT